MEISAAMHFMYLIAANEAVFMKCKFLEMEHFFISLCKIGELIVKDLQFPPDFGEEDKQETIREIACLSEIWKKQGVDSRQLRRRLRFLISQEQLETGEFTGHRSQQGREVFHLAETIANEHRQSHIDVMTFLVACLRTESRLLKMLFDEYQVPIRAIELSALPAGLIDEDLEEDTRLLDDEDDFIEEDEHFLAQYGRDLTALARQGKLGSLIGRRDEIKHVARVLTQRSRNNPLLVGDPGVGKTAVVEGLAMYMAQPDAVESLQKLHIVEITMSALVAGTKYRGDFENRIKEVIDTAKSEENLVLFIDELHTMIGAGAVEGTLDASNILKPALGRSEINIIGATTTSEYRKHIEPDGALTRRFQLVWINEPSYQETLQILEGVRPKFAQHHDIQIPDEILDDIVRLTNRFITEGFQPDKALTVLDEACARRKLLTLGPIRPGMQMSTLELDDVGKVIARRTQVPLPVILTGDDERLLQIEEALSKEIIGQNHAISVVAKSIRISRAGLRPSNQPVVLMFIGPTGTGKTELAKALARFLFYDSKRLIRLDLSEYMESHSVSKIIGSPPGYIGFGEEPLFIREIRKHPYSVVLLDEIEKAHPNVLMTFLQVFDEGRLTDARGKTINCSEAIFIMTSNLGSGLEVKPAIGFNLSNDEVLLQQKAANQKYHDAIVSHFSPELVNRIQEIVVFLPLTHETISKILDIYLAEINKQLLDRRIDISLDENAKRRLSQSGYSAQYGARFLKRVFNRWITEPLSEHILSGNLKAGASVRIKSQDDSMILEIHDESGITALPYSVDGEDLAAPEASTQ